MFLPVAITLARQVPFTAEGPAVDDVRLVERVVAVVRITCCLCNRLRFARENGFISKEARRPDDRAVCRNAVACLKLDNITRNKPSRLYFLQSAVTIAFRRRSGH